MKILLLQLPLQGHDFFYSNENIPLASAYLQAIAAQEGMDAELLPSHLMSYGSDQAILQFLLDARPNLIGMSCYLWNVERSLYLAGQLKQHLPSCTIVLGGPEISPENDFLLRHRDFDIGVVGEGEETWKLLLQAFPRAPDIPGVLLPKQDGQWHFSGNQRHPPSLENAPSAFLAGVLDAHLRGVLWLETVRGCVHRCAYCYYHKQSPHPRTFSLERIFKEGARACERGLQEIVFLDPCFSGHRRLEALLDGLAVANRDRRLRLHAECNVEGINPRMAEKMSRAGFRQIEVGLQSVNRRTLRNIHRIFHPQRFLQGVRSLQESGIEVMVDLIAGLPGDQLSDICRGLDWVVEHGAYDFLMLYPLSLMTGTELQQRAHPLGLKALPHPPYLLTQNREISAGEISQAFRYYEKRMEEDINPLEMSPGLDASSATFELPGGLCHKVNWDTPERITTFSHAGNPPAYALTVSMTGEALKQYPLWFDVLGDHLDNNPFTLLSIEVPPDVFPEELNLLWRLVQKHPHPIDRDYTVTHTPYRSLLVFSRAKGLLWKWPDPRESSPLVLPDGQKVPCHPVCVVATSERTIPPWFFDHIRQRYPSPPEIRLWQPPEDA